MIMAEPLVRVFDNIAAAEEARRALLEIGFDPDAVQLSANEDEAGPVEGNFLLDEKDTGQGPAPGPISKMFGLETRTGAYNNDTPAWRSSIRIVVAASDDAHMARANEILDRFSAGDVEARRH
jgi:hypothetical protein